MAKARTFDARLTRLNRLENWTLGLAALILVALSATLAFLQLTLPPGTASVLFPAPGTTTILLEGLCALVLLFSLQILVKHLQTRRLRAHLFKTQLQHESLRSRLIGLSSMLEGVARANTSVELEPTLGMLTDHLRQSMTATRCSIYLAKDGVPDLECVAVSGDNAETLRGSRAPLDGSMPGWVVQNNEPLLLSRDSLEKFFHSEFLRDTDFFSALAVPLAIEARVTGALCLCRLGTGPLFAQEDTQTLLLCAAHVAIAIRRIREHERFEQLLREREEQLRQAEKMETLGRLAGGVAHDFNNLLTVILCYAQQIAKALDQASPYRSKAAAVVDAAEHAASLTQRLLAFSRRQVLELGEVDLNACVEGVGEILRRLVGDDISLVIKPAPELGAVLADRAQVEQVVLNLAANAKEAMPYGGRLEIATAKTSRGVAFAAGETHARQLEYAVLRVSDNGVGVDAETQAHMFDPYFTTKPRGTGMGLATVYGIVKQCGGDISVTSELGRGTTIEVYLPLTQKPLETILKRDLTPSNLGGSETILLAEDQPSVRRLLRETLESHGYTVLEAANAECAMDLVHPSERSVDLVLTDVVMPGRSGRELAEWIEALHPDTTVLLMSGFREDEKVPTRGQDGNVAFLQKPFSEAVLLAKVRSLLDRNAAGPQAEGLRKTA